MVSGESRYNVVGKMRLHVGDRSALLRNGGNKVRNKLPLRLIRPTVWYINLYKIVRPPVRHRWPTGPSMSYEWGQIGGLEILGVCSGGIRTWEER